MSLYNFGFGKDSVSNCLCNFVIIIFCEYKKTLMIKKKSYDESKVTGGCRNSITTRIDVCWSYGHNSENQRELTGCSEALN